MNNNKISKLWFLSAICFMIAGIVGKAGVYIILGCAFICIASSKREQKTNSNDDINK